MKKMASILCLVSLISCSKGNNTEAKKYKPTKAQVEQKFEEEMDKNRVDICVVPEKRKSFLSRFKAGIVGLFYTDGFDIQYSEELTTKVLKELKAYVISEQGFSPEEFWLAITPETKLEINKLLIDKFVKLEDEQFLRLRELVAFSFLFYFQEKEENRQDGYEFHLDDEAHEVSKIRVAYNQSADFEKRSKIGMCDNAILGNVDFIEDPDGFTLPSEVVSKIECKKKDRRAKLTLMGDDTLRLELNSSALTENITLFMGDIVVNSTYRGARLIYSQDGNELNLKITKKRDHRRRGGSVVRGYKDNTIQWLTIEGRLDGGEDFKLKSMSCKTIKQLMYE